MDQNEYEEYRAIISALPDMVFVITESGHYANIVGGDCSELYHNADPLKGVSLFDVLPVQKANWFIDRIQETLTQNKLMIFEYSLSSNDVASIDDLSGPNGILRFEGRVNPLKSPRYGERAVVWVARNITKRHQLEKQLLFQSEIDELSELYNRRKLFSKLSSAFTLYQQHNDCYSFLVLDIDNFKAINDTHGHQSGDAAIQKLAKICQVEINSNDIVGRIGGDEFAIIHKNTSPKSAVELASKINQAVIHLSSNDRNSEPQMTVSIGLSQFKKEDDSIDQVYQRSDMALYEAKRKGKNQFSSQ
ncbi:sensor domain-containing diguanylate cyclase [Vibrio rumoiensis]|nr:sensor domain-containing diguanylate cyclase [Vibrio rumoiensis]